MNENYERWLAYLDTAKEPQAQEALVQYVNDENPDDREVGYCCLGIACKIAPDGERFIQQPGDLVLLPIVVGEWLGLRDLWEDTHEEFGEDYSWDRLLRAEPDKGIDLLLDIPEDHFPRDTGEGTNLTASWLNDSGFTFPQIAQMLRYFGVRKVTA